MALHDTTDADVLLTKVEALEICTKSWQSKTTVGQY